jgi:hypothetical protein
MPFSIDQYSRRKTMSARGAMSLALSRFLEQQTFHNPGPFRFARVFSQWPSFVDKFVSPSACVLPGEWRYVDALMTPALCPETVEPPSTVPGQMAGDGFGLYKLSEVEQDFEISMRASSVGERDAIVETLEEIWHAPGLLMNDASGARYGILLPLPEYFGVDARFSLLSARTIDNEETAIREHRDAVFTLSGQTIQVTVGPVSPLRLTVNYCQILPDGTEVKLR